MKLTFYRPASEDRLNKRLQQITFRTIACHERPGMDNEACQVSSDACINVCSPAVTVQLPTVDGCNERTTKKGRRTESKG